MKCFYHGDIDGKCSAAIVAHYTGNYSEDDYIEFNYDREIPTDIIADGEVVYFVDLSFSENTVDKLREILTKNCKLIWIDHHTSSSALLKKYPAFEEIPGIRREENSGAYLTWEYLEKTEVPQFIKLISDFDCWQFKYSSTLPFKYALESKDHEPLSVLWNKLIRDSRTSTVPSMIVTLVEQGMCIQEYVNRELEDYRDCFAYEATIDGINCLVVNRCTNSLVFGDKINKYDMVAIWVFDGSLYKYSLYSAREEMDVSLIAEKFGGGGHAKAAGFVSKNRVDIPSIK